MKIWLKVLFLFLLVAGVGACKKEVEPPEVELLENAAIDSPNHDWQFNYVGNVPGNPNGCDGAFSLDIHASPPYALRIGCTEVRNFSVLSYWWQTISSPTIPVGKKLVLKAKVRLDGVTGGGVALALRGTQKGRSGAVFFETTEINTPIRGTSDFTDYALILDSYPGSVDEIQVFLIYLRNTTGTAYFDDISLAAR
jgi:hypothetical protein